MNELGQILRSAQEAVDGGHPALLATLVRVHGSTYRRPGARMLLTGDRWTAGSISGGCLEGDILRKAWWRTESGPSIVVYDSTGDDEDDLVWGLGCQGVVEVLLERLTPEGAWPLAILSRWRDARQTGVYATVLRVEGESAVRVGQRLTLGDDGEVRGDVAGELHEPLLHDARDVLAGSSSLWRTYALQSGVRAEVFLERIEPPLSLVIFGGGHDVVPLVRLAKEQMGWHVTVVDLRAGQARPERFPGADAVYALPPTDALAQIPLGPRDGVVLMTHNLFDDQKLLGPLLASAAGYLGVLGPRNRLERVLRGAEALSPEALARLYAPVGLDIGADNPEAIALSVVAEMQAVFAKRDGGMLRERPGPIHLRDIVHRSHSSGAGEAVVCQIP